MKYKDLTYQVIGCAMKVHNELGNGFQEVIYQRAIAAELAFSNLQFSREVSFPVYYNDEQIGRRRVDFIIEDKLVLELKARSEIEDHHLAQAINYLTAFNLETGLLINFGAKSLQYKRIFNKNRNYNPKTKFPGKP